MVDNLMEFHHKKWSDKSLREKNLMFFNIQGLQI